MNKIKILDKIYKIEDTLEYIPLADSFVKNKLGTGHGEAKLYVGNDNERTKIFFENIRNRKCFFKREDFEEFLKNAEKEYTFPEQNYISKEKMPLKYENLKKELKEIEEEILYFDLYKVDVKPPRVYMNSTSKYYDFMREIGLPNISYLSVMKLIDNVTNEISLYFKIFLDYNTEIETYKTSISKEIKDKNLLKKKYEFYTKARVGQGKYREKLLLECPFCPFTLVNDERLLIASHIKPWAVSDDKEKIDCKNGFIFTPTYDKLFDRGFITFDKNKKLIVSPWLSPMNQKKLGIKNGKIIKDLPMDSKREKYLKYHLENIFKK